MSATLAFAILLLAIAAEVTATLALKGLATASSAFAWPLVLFGYGAAFWLLARSLAVLPVGVAYAIWAGLGTVGVAIAGVYLFGERLTPLSVAGIGLVGTGVVLLGLSAPAHF